MLSLLLAIFSSAMVSIFLRLGENKTQNIALLAVNYMMCTALSAAFCIEGCGIKNKNSLFAFADVFCCFTGGGEYCKHLAVAVYAVIACKYRFGNTLKRSG